MSFAMARQAAPYILAVGLAAFAIDPAAAQSRLKTYETSYYVIHTDLDAEAVREAASRITTMGETYWQRTKSFAGRITHKFDFYLFSDPDAYYAAGGMEGSAGVYDPAAKRLMAIALPWSPETTWHVIQHEGFHQFVRNVIGGDIPIWVNEGLAEYFGEAIYTGDGYVTGVVTPSRAAKIKSLIQRGATKSLKDMMLTTHGEWNVDLNVANYDQAWSMVHFLAHAADGRYQEPFGRFIADVGRGMKWEHAWSKHIGSGTQAFEAKWKEYWLQMPAEGTIDLYVEAHVATLTSFYARAFSQRQMFQTFEAFETAARAGQLNSHPDDWLPPALLEQSLDAAPKLGQWQVRKRTGWYELVCTTPDGSTFTGTFKVRSRRVVPNSIKVTRRGP